MTLTIDQKRDLQEGRPVMTVLDGLECVLLARTKFDQVQKLLDYDDSRWTSDERARLLQSFGERAGWDDPALDVYEQYRKT